MQAADQTRLLGDLGRRHAEVIGRSQAEAARDTLSALQTLLPRLLIPGASEMVADYVRDAGQRWILDRVLIGLSLAETTEFEALDRSPIEAGAISDTVCASVKPAIRQTRRVELYAKHDQAWRARIALSRGSKLPISALLTIADQCCRPKNLGPGWP